jgi:hypothetical protein
MPRTAGVVVVDVELGPPASRDVGPAYLADPALRSQHPVVVILGHAELVFQMTASDCFGTLLQILSLIRQHLLGVFPHVARMACIAAFLALTVKPRRPVVAAVKLPIRLGLLALTAGLL